MSMNFDMMIATYMRKLIGREKTLEQRFLKTEIITPILKSQCSIKLNYVSRASFLGDFLKTKTVSFSFSGFTLSLHYKENTEKSEV